MFFLKMSSIHSTRLMFLVSFFKFNFNRVCVWRPPVHRKIHPRKTIFQNGRFIRVLLETIDLTIIVSRIIGRRRCFHTEFDVIETKYFG